MGSPRGESSRSSDPVRLLVVDKTAVMPHIRDRWERFAHDPSIEMTLLLPSSWIENYREYHVTRSLLDRYTFSSVIGRPALKGAELRGFYRSGVSRAFREASPDVIVMMEESFSLFGLQITRAAARYAPDAPIIFYNNNIVSYDLPGFRLSRLYRAIGSYVTPRMALGLCVNARADAVLRDAGYGVPSTILFYGIDEERFPVPDESERISARRDAGLPRDRPIVLYLGRLLAGKGIETLIDAVAEAGDLAPEPPYLLIVGSGPHEEAVRAYAAERLAGETCEIRPAIDADQVPQLLRSVDMHVLPSLPEINEQFGRVNVEAMLTGLVTVGSRTGGIPEVIGDSGLLFEPGNVSELAEILRRCFGEGADTEALRRRGRERALALYSSSAFNDRLRQIVLGLGRGGDPRDLIDSDEALSHEE